MSANIVKIKPKHYIHILDTNTGITSLAVGPKTVTLQDHEDLALRETPMIILPPRHYCVILNPVIRDENNNVVIDDSGQVKVKHGDKEIRFESVFSDPFPLYPGEELEEDVEELEIVPPNKALRLQAIRPFDEVISNGDGEECRHINAGDEWLFKGSQTYIPRIEVEVLSTIDAIIIEPNTALKLKAVKQCIDCYGNERKAGEQWLIKEEGAYIPNVDEKVVKVIQAITLTEDTALSLEAIKSFTDIYGTKRKAGEQWLVTLDMAESHIVDVYEKYVSIVEITTIKEGYWAKILNPIDSNNKPQLGKEEIRKGLIKFFLHPGEVIEGDVRKAYVLGKDESLLLTALRKFMDDSDSEPVTRSPGDKWMIVGPKDYIPTIDIDLDKIVKRPAIPLDDNEGKYVRDDLTGKVRLVMGNTFMLQPNEELWEKNLPEEVERLLNVDPISGRRHYVESTNQLVEEQEYSGYGSLRKMGVAPRSIKSTGGRDKTNAVTYRVPQGAICQIYDYKERKPRYVVGPGLVMLKPDEDFTVLNLSGGKPKQACKIRSLALMTGPDFMTDYVDVETSDHAPLRLRLAYNWYFKIDDSNPEESYRKIFSVPDFVGDVCKTIASRVRAVVAMTDFDTFHRNSARLIRTAVFGKDEKDKIKDEFMLLTNNLVITNIDIQGIEPKDPETKENLQKSVKLAIKITTDAQEAEATRKAQKIAQEAKASLELQDLIDKKKIEMENTELLKQQANSAAIQSSGQAVAEAKAQAEADKISSESKILFANNTAEAAKIKSSAELEMLKAQQEAELAHQEKLAKLEIDRAKQLAEISAEEFKTRVSTIGPDVIAQIAKAGPELQAQLLKGLGIKSVLITDGKNPLNLFSTAKGLIGDGNPEPETEKFIK